MNNVLFSPGLLAYASFTLYDSWWMYLYEQDMFFLAIYNMCSHYLNICVPLSAVKKVGPHHQVSPHLQGRYLLANKAYSHQQGK